MWKNKGLTIVTNADEFVSMVAFECGDVFPIIRHRFSANGNGAITVLTKVCEHVSSGCRWKDDTLVSTFNFSGEFCDLHSDNAVMAISDVCEINILIFISFNQLPPTEVGGLFLSSVVERLKADSLPKDSIL